MQLNCRSCGVVVPAENIDLPTSTAKCASCAAVFSFAGEVLVPRERVGRPEHMSVTGTEPVVVVWRQVDPQKAALSAGVGVLFIALMGWFVWQADPPLDAGRLALIGGAVLVSFVPNVASFVNRVTLTIGRSEVVRTTGPIPVWKGTVRVPSSAVAQVFCVQKTRYVTNSKSRDNGRPIHSWAVVVKRKDGGPEVTLVEGLQDARHGVFLEQTIERHLRVEDKQVAGAVL